MSLIVGLLRPIPIVAWVPVLILWMGIGEASKVTVIAIGSFWPVLLNVTDGIRNVDVKYKEVAQVFIKPKRIELFRVILPGALPMIFTGLRISVGTAWVSVIGAELIASSSGLGYLIQYSRELSQPANMLVGVFAIGIIGLLINKLIVVIEKYALHWNRNVAEKK
jgi:sulfonate transport system permease protein